MLGHLLYLLYNTKGDFFPGTCWSRGPGKAHDEARILRNEAAVAVALRCTASSAAAAAAGTGYIQHVVLR